jgi:hypothetical protein
MTKQEENRASIEEGKRMFALVQAMHGTVQHAQVHDLPVILDIILQEVVKRNDAWLTSICKLRVQKHFKLS